MSMGEKKKSNFIKYSQTTNTTIKINGKQFLCLGQFDDINNCSYNTNVTCTCCLLKYIILCCSFYLVDCV